MKPLTALKTSGKELSEMKKKTTYRWSYIDHEKRFCQLEEVILKKRLPAYADILFIAAKINKMEGAVDYYIKHCKERAI